MVNKTPNVRTKLKLFVVLPMLVALAVFCYLGRNRAPHPAVPVLDPSALPFAAVPMGSVTADLFTAHDPMHAAGNDVFLQFRDAHKNLVDVGDVTLELELKNPGMVMHSIGKVVRTEIPGQYRTTIAPQMAGDWSAKIGFAGSHGTFETNFTVPVH